MKTQGLPAWLLKSLLGAQRLVEKKIYNSMSVMSSRGPLAAERPQTQEAVGTGERSREGTRKHPARDSLAPGRVRCRVPVGGVALAPPWIEEEWGRNGSKEGLTE